MPNRRRRMPAFTRLVALMVPVALLVAGIASPAYAFKPFTHANTGFDARADVIDDGRVTIGTRSYAVDPRVVTALRDWPSYYNAGVIGPDGFPDLTMGQSIVHPVDTGRWLRYLLAKAWAAQSDPSYSAAEKSQILAFTYGFLTHAAGDMWAHTLVNELSGEVFPAVGDVLTDPVAASIAIRHIIVEGYIGDATPGFDGNPDRTTLPDGDVSDDSTPGIDFDSPNRFIYQTLVAQNADAPSTERGPLIGFFTDLRSSLADFVSSSPMPLQDALDQFNDTRDDLNNLGDACDFDDVIDLIDCPAALLELGFDVVVDSVEALHAFVTSTLEALAKVVLDAYVNAWIDDIDDGLAHWGELGLASTRALFDPQAKRDTQNDECDAVGSESQQVRINCEDGIGPVDVLLHEADPFINDHLLSMLGAPDFVGGLREILAQVSDLIDDIVGPALNPVREVLADIKEAAKDLVKDMIKDRFGLDIDQIQDFLDSPSSKMDLTSVDLGPLGTVSLFAPDAHAKLDEYLHLPTDHHNGAGGGLSDDVAFDKTQFAAYDNTVTTAKLLLLDGPVLDDVLSDLSGHPYHLYGDVAGSNLMTTTLPGAGGPADQWLRLIDGDHAWRSNGRPVFDRASAGEGNFPLWESCILRDDGFRALYADWENGTDDFPALGDDPSTDPNDPAPPATTLGVGAPKFVSGGTTYVGAATPLNATAHDDFWRDDEIKVDVRVRAGSETGGAFTTQDNGSTVSLAGLPDGPVHVDVRAHDACRTEAVHTIELVLDTTPPVVTYTQPALSQYATDQFSSIAFTVSDGPQGSGVASSSVTFDGAPATNGQTLDMFFLAAGLHTIEVTATDNIGNTGTTTRAFRVRATAASLLNNLDRARSLGLVPDQDVYRGLRDSLVAANKSHDKGKHPTEWNQLGAFVNQLLGQAGNGIDAATAFRFIGYAQDLVASGG